MRVGRGLRAEPFRGARDNRDGSPWTVRPTNLRCWWVAACLGGAVFARADAISISWRAEANPPAVEVVGASSEIRAAFANAPEPARIFAVFAQQDSAKSMPPMSGAWRVVDDRLRFEPLFPFARGVRYRAEFRTGEGAEPVISFFEMPALAPAAATTVVQIYPTADVLPENQLKFYVHFSAPMSRRGVYEHVQIRDAQNQRIELPFLELDEELWDPGMTRLTLLIDPGRIKRGVKPLEDIGPVFEAGKSYALVIDGGFLDAEGRPLGTPFEKRFRAAAADRRPPDPARWKIRAPATGTRDSLEVDFDEPLDHALALRLIRVRAPDGKPLEGTTTLDHHEMSWRFAPAQPWARGDYRLTVATTIEDLAGNNVGKAFDVDVFEDVHRRVETPVVSVAFAVK